jgi:hypothetical protein
VSDVSQGPGWWLASDGRWYSPDQAPGFAPPSPGPTAPPATPPYGPPPTPAGYGPPIDPVGYGPPSGPPAYGSPPGPPGYAPPFNPGYGYPQALPPYGYAPVGGTNGLAIASLVCSLFFWVWGVGAILAIIFGFIARSQIRRSGDTQQGGGLALAGIIIGFAGIVIGIGLIVALVVASSNSNQPYSCSSSA